jgi:hypothetical protein
MFNSIHRSKHWCFTLNNYTEDELTYLKSIHTNASIQYLVFQCESGTCGMPHVQGYVCYTTKKSIKYCKELIPGRGHYESARCSPSQNHTYCLKSPRLDGQYEYGTIPGGRYKRSSWASAFTFISFLRFSSSPNGVDEVFELFTMDDF